MADALRQLAEALGQLRVQAPQGNAGAELRLFMDFMAKCPTFDRAKDRWSDFAARFRMHRRIFDIVDDRAKEALWNAITGKSSRIVVASMEPTQGAYANMTFAEYIDAMGRKFTPASESMQMKSEYKSRVQGKQEDVQNYINEKYELYRLAYPENNQDLSDFYVETTRGIANKYVRNSMWSYRPRDVVDYGETAVHYVQVERQRVANGDSESNNMDGLTPVTRVTARTDRGEPMEVDHLRQREMYEGDESEDDDGECECMALHEKGFRGVCYYCQRKGHLLRNCPRKSVGLPRVGGTSNMQKPNAYRATGGAAKKQWKPMGGTRKKTGFPTKKRINAIQGEEEEQEEVDEEQAEETAEDEVSFLGEMAL